jgi:hypothetical protein
MEEIDVIENAKNGPYTKVNMRNYINNYLKKKILKKYVQE